MLRVLLDTSNHVKAILYPIGASGAVIDACTDGLCQLICSESIVAEISDVLDRPRIRKKYPKLTDAAIDLYLTHLHDIADMVPGELAKPGSSVDQKDEHILAAAVEGKADYLVSADQGHLLSLGEFEGIPIVTAAEFLKRLRATQ